MQASPPFVVNKYKNTIQYVKKDKKNSSSVAHDKKKRNIALKIISFVSNWFSPCEIRNFASTYTNWLSVSIVSLRQNKRTGVFSFNVWRCRVIRYWSGKLEYINKKKYKFPSIWYCLLHGSFSVGSRNPEGRLFTNNIFKWGTRISCYLHGRVVTEQVWVHGTVTNLIRFSV